jgi:CubicO group peptidase (beta-lactamase class C family)
MKLIKWTTASYLLIFCSALFFSCDPKPDTQHTVNTQFVSEIDSLQKAFSIPGMAIAIDQSGKRLLTHYSGFSDLEQKIPIDESVLFPIASVTKLFSGIVLMKLVEKEQLSLNDPVDDYLTSIKLGDSIRIKHLLSHTSQGIPGEAFYYSSRFSLLTEVIEQAAGEPFDQIFEDLFIEPLGLENSFLLKNAAQLLTEKRNIAKPYVLEQQITEGYLDFGYSASAGVVSNLEDLSAFNKALDEDLLISEASKKQMFRPFKPGLPYGFGVFSQTFSGMELIWAYGQYDCYSSLFLKIPEKEITLIILSNNSLMSDTARLINGDALSSLFVLSFLRNYVLEAQSGPNKEQPQQEEFQRHELLANALAAAYMARYDSKEYHRSIQLLSDFFNRYPNYTDYANLNLMHNLAFLKDVAYYMHLGSAEEFDQQFLKIGKLILSKEPYNPYAHIYLANYYSRRAEFEKAVFHYQSIVQAPNFSSNWYTEEARIWLANYQNN